MDEDSAERLVSDGQRRGFAVLHIEILRRGIQTVALRRFDFQRVIRPGVQRRVNASVLPGGHGLDKAAFRLADFKGYVGNPDGTVVLVDLDNLHAADRVIVDGDGLRFVCLYLHSLRAGGGVDFVAVNGLHFRNDDRSGNAGNDNLPFLVRGVQAVARQVSSIDERAVGVGDFELYSRNRLLRDGIQLVED